MTAQIPDTYHYKGKKYSIIAMSAPIDFDPVEYGFFPISPHTACWRGYVCEYEITDDELYLRRLSIWCGNHGYPEFDGILPVEDTKNFGHFMVYENLHHHMDYTGSIVVGSGFLKQYYIHMGFQRAWAYKNVFELKFEHGRVKEKIDHSEYVKGVRKKIKEDPEYLDKVFSSITGFIDESFSLDKNIKAWWI